MRVIFFLHLVVEDEKRKKGRIRSNIFTPLKCDFESMEKMSLMYGINGIE